ATSSAGGPELVTSYANGTMATASADADGNEVALSATSPALGISYTGDAYDANSQVTSTSATGLSNDTGTFGYDPAGNPTTTLSPTTGAAVTQSFNSAEQLTGTTSGSTTTTYGYDSIGDRTSMSVSGGSSTAYTYTQV